MSKERRETYKVTVTEKELPQKSTPQRIETNVIAAKEDYVNTESKVALCTFFFLVIFVTLRFQKSAKIEHIACFGVTRTGTT